MRWGCPSRAPYSRGSVCCCAARQQTPRRPCSGSRRCVCVGTCMCVHARECGCAWMQGRGTGCAPAFHCGRRATPRREGISQELPNPSVGAGGRARRRAPLPPWERVRGRFWGAAAAAVVSQSGGRRGRGGRRGSSRRRPVMGQAAECKTDKACGFLLALCYCCKKNCHHDEMAFIAVMQCKVAVSRSLPGRERGSTRGTQNKNNKNNASHTWEQQCLR